MKSLMVLACALALPGIAVAADHGPVFGYATPVNSQRELSFDFKTDRGVDGVNFKVSKDAKLNGLRMNGRAAPGTLSSISG